MPHIDLSRRILRISFAIASCITLLMWVVFALDYSLHLKLYHFGVKPLHLNGLVGIITAPFLHSTDDFQHILNNSGPAFILTWLLFYHYRTIAAKSFLFIYLVTGALLWLIGRDSYHIGMSSIIYGISSFLIFSGLFRKNMRVSAVSMLVIFLYGSLIWGIFPSNSHVSWEGHLSGFLTGLIAAFLFQSQGPQPAKMTYEIEEELGIEPENEYWKTTEIKTEDHKNPQTKIQNKFVIRYKFIPKNTSYSPDKKSEEEE